MIAKKELKEFIKETINEVPFKGCNFIDLDCTDSESHELYLVFACYEEENEMMLCYKIAYNCDDLQCDYEYDWTTPEELYYEYEYDCKNALSLTDEDIDREVKCILESIDHAIIS